MSDNNGPVAFVTLFFIIATGISFMVVINMACKKSFNLGVKETQNKAIEAGVGTFVQVKPGSSETMFVFTNSITK